MGTRRWVGFLAPRVSVGGTRGAAKRGCSVFVNGEGRDDANAMVSMTDDVNA